MASSVNSTSSGNLSYVTSSALGTTHMNGLVSGLDIDGLVSATIQADSLPMQLLQNKNSLLQAQMNDYNSIKTSLFSLQSAVTNLTFSSTFSTMKTSSSDDSIVTAVAQNGSNSNSYTVNVSQMATSSNIIGARLAMATGTYAQMQTTVDISGNDRNTAINSASPTVLGGAVHAGTFTVNSQVITVTATDTINTILNKISASSAGVTATMSSDGKNIVLTQKTAGAKPTITLGTDSSGFLAATGLNTANLTAGTDADDAVNFSSLAGANALSGVTKGYFSINGTFISVDPATDSVDSIINKINSSGAGVTAFYDSTNNKISLVSNKVGSSNDITLGTYNPSDPTATDTSNFLSLANLTAAAGATHTTGNDAQVTINGVTAIPTNNSVTWNGVTFTLNGTGTATVTVNNDIDSTVKTVQDFITQYNSTIDLINGKLSEQPDSSSTDPSVGDLFGDSTLRNISMQLRAFSYAVVPSAASSLQQLSQVGITTGPIGQAVSNSESGHLSLDENALRSALQANPNAVKALFGNTIASVSNENPTGAIDGSNTVFQLANGSVSSPTVVVNGVTYTQVNTTPQAYNPYGTPPQTQHQYSIDYTSGKITFGDPPPSGANIEVSYNYQLSQGSSGIFVQMSNLLDSYTQVGGTFDAITGSNGSITNQMSYNKDRIDEMNQRLQDEQSSLYTQFQAMEAMLEDLKSQSNFLTAQLSSLSSSSSK